MPSPRTKPSRTVAPPPALHVGRGATGKVVECALARARVAAVAAPAPAPEAAKPPEAPRVRDLLGVWGVAKHKKAQQQPELRDFSHFLVSFLSGKQRVETFYGQ